VNLPAVRASAAGAILAVRVSPAARKSRLLGIHGGALKISVAAPPERGRANDATLDLLSGLLDVEKSRLSIASGETSRDKSVLLRGFTPEEVRARLLILFGRP